MCPAVHDSAVITNTDLPRQGHNLTTPAATVGDIWQGDISKTPMVNFEDTKAARDDPIAPRDHVPGQKQNTGHADFERPAVRREDLNLGPKSNFSGPTTGSVLPGLGEEIAGQPKTSVLWEGPHAPQNTPVPLTHGNYKTTKDTEPRPTFVSGQGGHDFEQSRVNLERPRGLEEDTQAPRANPQVHTPSNYEAKVTDPTSEGGEEVGISPILHSFDKMNLHGGAEHKPHDQNLRSGIHDQVPSLSTGSHDQFSHGPHDSTATETPLKQSTTYTDKISSATPAIADKATSAKNVVASKLGYGGESDQQHNQVSNLSTGSHDQFSQGGPHDTEKPSNQSSSYIGKAPSATSAVADKAVSAKNVVASKLGYGGNDKDHDEYPRGRDQSGDDVRVGGTVNSGASSAPDQQKQSSSYTGKISSATSAIADKAISAKNVVASKLGYGGTGENQDQVHDQRDKTTGATVADKGASVKEYFAEKLRPGEEDKALSEVITGALHKRKAEEPEEVVAKETYKAEYSVKPVGKVTESEEVQNRLGNTEGNENFVVDRIKGVVGSWFGKSGDQQQEVGGETEPNRSHVVEDRKLPGSGN